MMQITSGTAEFENMLKERLNRKKLVNIIPTRVGSPRVISGDTLTTVLGKGRGGRIGDEIKDLNTKLMHTIENLDIKVETAILRKENRLFQAIKDVISQRKSLERMNAEDLRKAKDSTENKESKAQNSMEENIKKLYEFTDKKQEKKTKDLETLKIDNSLLRNEIQELREQIKRERKANKEMVIALSKGDGKQYFEKLEGSPNKEFYKVTREFIKSNRLRSKTFPEYLKEVIKRHKQSKDDHFQPEEFIARLDELILFMEIKLEQITYDHQSQIETILAKNKELVEKIKIFSGKMDLLKVWDDCVKTMQEPSAQPSPRTQLLLLDDPPKKNQNIKKMQAKLSVPEEKRKDLLNNFFNRREVFELVKDKLLSPFQLLAEQHSLTERTANGDDTVNTTNQNNITAFAQTATPEIKKFEITLLLNKHKVPPLKKFNNSPDGHSPRKIPANGINPNTNVSF